MKKIALMFLFFLYAGVVLGKNDDYPVFTGTPQYEEGTPEAPIEDLPDPVLEKDLPAVIVDRDTPIEDVPMIHFFNKEFRKAQGEAGVHHWSNAKARLRRLINITTNLPVLQAIAGQEMGTILVEEARTSPWPNALAAEQYLEGVLELNKNPERLPQIQNLLLEARKILYSYQLKELPETGSYFQMAELLEKAKPVLSSAQQQLEVKLAEANMLQQVFMNPAWFRSYMRQHPDEVPAAAKARLREKIMNDYLWLTQNTRGDIRDEAFFKSAQLLAYEGEYEDADKMVQAFLENGPLSMIPETMILLAKIARATGDTRKAAQLLMQAIDRYGLTRESQQEMDQVINELVEQEHYKVAADTLEKLMHNAQLMENAPDYSARRLVLMAQHYKKTGQPDKAEEIYSRIILSDYSPALKQAAVSKLFEIYLSKNKGTLEMLLIGIETVEADPDNEYANAILLQMAETVEKMGLPRYAQEIYDKIAILGLAIAESSGDTNALPFSIDAATLGTARCYYKEGNYIKADYLFRKICNNYALGPLHAEAAFWWAQVAFDTDQLQEASRRLGLIDFSYLPPVYAAKASVLAQYISIKMGISNEEIITPVLHDLASLPETEHAFLRQYYTVFFEMWNTHKDLDAMKKWYLGCLQSPHQSLIPLDYYFYTIANEIMQKDGKKALFTFINSDDDLLPAEQKKQLLADLWVPRIDEMKTISLNNHNLKLAIAELHKKMKKQR